MRILIDIGHPAHVYLFKNLYREIKQKGHAPIVTVRNVPSAKTLLSLFSIPFLELGSKSDSIKGKLFNQIKYDLKLLKIINDKNINLAVGSSITIAHVSKISQAKSIVFDDDDDEVQPLMTKFGHPFADLVLSPDVLTNKRKKKGTIYYAGYHELAYLHPKRFSPDPCILKDAGITEGEKYFILRFNSFKAHHDVGIKGLSIENKRKLVNMLSEYGKVFITTERDIDPEFEKYKLSIPPDKIHSFIAFSTMLIGDSQTMTSEAALLGTPALKCNSFAGCLSIPNEIEYKYDLCASFKPENFSILIKKIEELMQVSDLKKKWETKRNKLLADKIDVTAFYVWFIENYPKSVGVMRENPDYQYNFK